MNRRTFLAKSALLGGVGMSARLRAQVASSVSASIAKPLRVGFITDTHVFLQQNCPAQVQVFLDKLASIEPAPDLVIHGGDVIFDAPPGMVRPKVKIQWDLWRELAQGIKVPIKYCIGNHDLWAGEGDADPLAPKRWAMAEMQLEQNYYAFSQGGWKFLVLDSIRPVADGLYDTGLDAGQRIWLANKLAQTPLQTPIAIVSHVPILSVSFLENSQLVPRSVKGKHPWWHIWAPYVHLDSAEVRAILRQRAGPILCLSGHVHMTDRITYDGIDYIGTGAVCGDWWNHHSLFQTPAGFSVLDLYPDGKFQHSYQSYEWKA